MARAVIANDPAPDPRGGGLPSGYPPLRAFLGIPFFHGDTMTGMVVVANRAGGYDDALVRKLAPILATCSSMVRAYDLERRRKASEQELLFVATHDSLTGLPNRAVVLDRLERLIAASGRDRLGFALLFADLDDFKVINDSLGHSAGDQLLKVVATRLLQTVREMDTVARFGGDEFILILADSTPETLQPAIDRIVAAIRRPVRVGDREIHTSVSIGVSLFPQDATGGERLLQNADMAMYLAKAQGKRAAFYFSAQVREAADERLSLEADLRLAMKHGEIALAYQPQIDLRSGALVGVEALVQWSHLRRGMVPAASLIALAEKTGLMIELGDFLLDSALKQLAKWKGEHKRIPRLSLNVSAVQLHDPGLVKYAVPPSEIVVEVTETALIVDALVAGERLRELKRAGIQVSLDDFGTGYSSLSFLRRFPIDELKIDRSFVASIDTNSEDRVIAQTVLAMGRSLNRGVVAEGIETYSHFEVLRALGCRVGQGFYFSKPCAPEGVVDSYSHLLAP